MVRAKGGKRNPRVYYLRNEAERKAFKAISNIRPKRKRTYSKVDMMIISLYQLMNEADSIINKIKGGMK